jgi:hypothetical protein
MKRADGWDGLKMSFHTASRWSKRVFHIQLAGRNTIGAHLSKYFLF